MSKTYENPILRGFNPDPSIVRVGEDYYMANSTFQYFPGVIIRHSKDLVNWQIIGHAFTRDEQLDLSNISDSHGIWAPDISYHNGLFYIFATLRLNEPPENTTGKRRCQLVATSTKPEGPYSVPFTIDIDSIDPSHFVDDDGKHYMVIAAGANVAELSEDCSKIVKEPVTVWPGTGLKAPEGPHILKKDGYYYAILAEGGTEYNHQISVARSRHLYGPYEPCPYNPVLKQTDPNARIQRSGHGKLVQTQHGDWWMVYLCGRRNEGDYTTLGRETCLDPVTWTDDGWFVVNDLKGPSEVQTCPSLPEYHVASVDFDDFNQHEISGLWQFVRNPERDLISLKEKESHLALTTTDYDLNQINARNIIVRRETEHTYKASTKLEFSPVNGEQAGITCYYGIYNYIKFYMTSDNGLKLKLLANNNSQQALICSIDISQNEIYLQVRVNKQNRSFYYSKDNKNWLLAGEVPDCTFLCDEGVTIGKHHTGTMVGLFAYNGGSSARLPAYFDWFSYSVVNQL